LIVTCEKCQTSFKLKDELVKPEGIRVRCSKCGNIFKVTKTGLAAGENKGSRISGDKMSSVSESSEKPIQTLPDGSKFSGVLDNNIPNGQGIMVFPDGARYEGLFQEGRFEGRGVLTLSDGMKYSGDFKKGLRDGNGVLTYPDGSIYTGGFKNGEFDGEGKLVLSDGSEFNTCFSGGKMLEK